VLNSIFDLSPEALQAGGIKLVLADLDNTLTSYEESKPSQAVRNWKSALEARGISLFVVSNSRKSHRCPDYCAALGVGYIRHAGKPRVRGFQAALKQCDCVPEEAIMVGDQIFTDIWGANRAGLTSVLVRPIAWGKNPLRVVRYALETPFRWRGNRRQVNPGGNTAKIIQKRRE